MAKAEEIPGWKQKAFHDIQELGRKVIALNGGKDIRFIRKEKTTEVTSEEQK